MRMARRPERAKIGRMLSRAGEIGGIAVGPARAEPDARDAYLTDGCRLFRVVEPFRISEADAHVFMSLEDCMTLEVQSYSPQQLYGMRLRPVTAAYA